MPRYAVAFDIDTRAMRADFVDRQGKSDGEYVNERTYLYRRDIPAALAACGTIRRKQGSVYHLDTDKGLEETIEELVRAAGDHAPHFRRYLRSVMIYPLGRGRDITRLMADRS